MPLTQTTHTAIDRILVGQEPTSENTPLASIGCPNLGCLNAGCLNQLIFLPQTALNEEI